MQKSIIQESKEIKFKGEIFENVKNDLNKLMYSMCHNQEKEKTMLCKHIDIACFVTGALPDLVNSKSRLMEVTWSRFMIYNYLHITKKMNHDSIAEIFNRDRTSIYAGIKRHCNLMYDMEYKKLNKQFQKLINEK